MPRRLRSLSARHVEVVHAEQVEPGAGAVRVAVRRCGICGSDLHWFTGRTDPPTVCPGHEISGIVDSVGPYVTGWTPGDRVTVEPISRCTSCERCRAGDYHLCRNLGIFGVTGDGGMATELVVPAYTLFRLPDTVDFELGALCEPLAVTVHALRLAHVGAESHVLILGAGSIGLLTAVAARHLGAASVTITARYDHQREMAERLGCDAVLDPKHPRGDGPRPSAVIETVGGEATTIDDAVRCVAKGGTVVMVGLFDVTPRFDPMAMLIKEVRLVGSNVYNRPLDRPADFETALDILESRGEALRPLVTHVYPLNQAQQAFATAADKSKGVLKVMLEP